MRWIRAAAGLARLFCIDLPLLVLVTLPAFLLAYVWMFARGGFVLGQMTFEETQG